MYDSSRKKIGQAWPELAISSFVYIGEGEDNIAFEINGSLIVRFAKRRAEALEREAAILGFVQAISPLPTPVLKYNRPQDGFIAYDKLPGIPLLKICEKVDVKQWPDFEVQLGSFMSAINSADVEPIKNCIQTDADSLETWRKESKRYFAQVRHLIPEQYHASIERFLSMPAPNNRFQPLFTHNDLGIEHILVDTASQQITGIIDWGDTALADPAYDFGKIYRDLGPEVFGAVLRAYTLKIDPGLKERAIFYAKCGVLEDLVYGMGRQSQEYINKCLASLSWLFNRA